MDYYTFHREVTSRRRRKYAAIVVAVLFVLISMAAGAYWFLWGNQAKPVDVVQETEAVPLEAAPAVTPVPTPAPVIPAYAAVRLLPEIANEAWNKSEPVAQTIDTEYLNTDARMAGVPTLGQTASIYFDTCTFLGDSITEGLEAYDVGANASTVLGYRGAGPNSVVNGVVCHDYTRRVDEVPMDALVASQPDYVYVMFGTNSLVTQGNEESFIAYYERMLDMMRETLNPGVIIYVEGILPVQAYVAETKPGLSNDRIRTVNNLIANMCLRKGCYYVNVPEALTDATGAQRAEFDADGIHMQPGGYRTWLGYVSTHTVWNRRTLYQGENPCYILGT